MHAQITHLTTPPVYPENSTWLNFHNIQNSLLVKVRKEKKIAGWINIVISAGSIKA